MIFEDNVWLKCEGTLDGNGTSKEFKTEDDTNRPKVIMFINCGNAKVEDLHMQNSSFWIQYYFAFDCVISNVILL